MKTEKELLKDANEILRSCNSVIERRGDETNWEAIGKRIKLRLDEQAEYFKQPIAEGETVYRKVSVNERLPKRAIHNTDVSIGVHAITDSMNPAIGYFALIDGVWVDAYSNKKADYKITHWLEETTLSVKSAKSIEECLKEVAKENNFDSYRALINYTITKSEAERAFIRKIIPEAMQLYLESNSQINMPSDNRIIKYLVDERYSLEESKAIGAFVTWLRSQ